MKIPVAVCIALVLAGCAAQTVVEPHQSNTSSVKDVNEILDDFHAAASKSDFTRYFAHWDEQSVFLGTDATERWGGQQFKDFAKPYFDKAKGWKYRPRARHTSISPDGRTAWFDELLDNDKYGECRGSGVLIRSGDRWLLVQYNLSIPMPNDLAGDLTDRIRRFQKPHQE